MLSICTITSIFQILGKRRGLIAFKGDFFNVIYFRELKVRMSRKCHNNTSTLILPRASASRASDVINMAKRPIFTVKNMWLFCLECVILHFVDEQRTRLQMPHALYLVVGRSIL